MSHTKSIRVPIEPCHKTKKHKGHLHRVKFGLGRQAIEWCPGVKK